MLFNWLNRDSGRKVSTEYLVEDILFEGYCVCNFYPLKSIGMILI